MMLEQSLAELLDKFGYGSLWTLISVLVVKYGVKPIFDMILEFRNEKNKKLLQHNLDKESELQSNVLEFEKYKKDVVIPLLQDLANVVEKKAEIIREYSVFLIADYRYLQTPDNTAYGRLIENKLEDFSKRNTDLLQEFLDKQRKVNIYLPKEIRKLLLTFQVIMERSFLGYLELQIAYDITLNEETHIKYARSVVEIYLKYMDCYYSAVEKYIEITHKEKNYKVIFENYDIDENGDYNYLGDIEYRCAADILGVVRKDVNEDEQLIENII